MSWQQIAEDPTPWLVYLGFPTSKARGLFPTAQSLKDAAKSGRRKLEN